MDSNSFGTSVDELTSTSQAELMVAEYADLTRPHLVGHKNWAILHMLLSDPPSAQLEVTAQARSNTKPPCTNKHNRDDSLPALGAGDIFVAEAMVCHLREVMYSAVSIAPTVCYTDGRGRLCSLSSLGSL